MSRSTSSTTRRWTVLVFGYLLLISILVSCGLQPAGSISQSIDQTPTTLSIQATFTTQPANPEAQNPPSQALDTNGTQIAMSAQGTQEAKQTAQMSDQATQNAPQPASQVTPTLAPPEQNLIDIGIKAGTIRQAVDINKLVFETRENLNKRGEKIVFARDPATNQIILATRVDPKTKEMVWNVVGLRDFADALGFRIGTQVSNPYYNSGSRSSIDAVVVQNFNTAVLEQTSFHQTEKTQGAFTFRPADDAVRLAQRHNMFIDGNSLVYGRSNFKYTFLKDLKNPTREQLIAIIQKHITEVMTHYKGKINTYTVTNESQPPTQLEQNTTTPYDPYWAVIGPYYVDIAFQTARSTDPSAMLIYNETRNETKKKRNYELTKTIVDRLKAKGLIDGVGIQMHLDGANPPSKAELIAAMQSYGIPVFITEFDVDMSKVEGTDAEKYQKQADVFRIVTQAFLESKVCVYLGFWDVNDANSWLVRSGGDPKAMPTMFDNDLHPKPAFFAVEEELQKALDSK